jgi:soluble lytic murein transglycosylase
LSSVSRHLPLAAGAAVMLAAVLAPLSSGKDEGVQRAEHVLARIMATPPGAPSRFQSTHATEPSTGGLPDTPQSAASLAAERNAAISAVEEASPDNAALAAIDETALGAIDEFEHIPKVPAVTPASAGAKLALATPYAAPDAPSLRPLPDLTPPAPLPPNAGAPALVPSQSGIGLLDKVMSGDWDPALAPLPASIAPPDADVARSAIAAYRKGDMALGDAFAATAQTEVAHAALDWVAIRMDSRGGGFRRITAFLKVHPDWPSASWLRRRSEEALYADKEGFALLAAYFAKAKPESAPGKLALARLYRNQGRLEDATALVREVWREGEFGQHLETKIIEEFGALLENGDHKFRADRAFYKEDTGRLMRAAQLAGPDEVALAKAQAAVIDEAGNAEALLAALPVKLKSDPSFIFARIQLLRRADKPDKLAEAAKLMLSATRDPALLVDGDAWWVERRLIARKLLDAGDAETAYRIASEHGAVSAESRIEAEFHAGWIGLLAGAHRPGAWRCGGGRGRLCGGSVACDDLLRAARTRQAQPHRSALAGNEAPRDGR